MEVDYTKKDVEAAKKFIREEMGCDPEDLGYDDGYILRLLENGF